MKMGKRGNEKMEEHLYCYKVVVKEHGKNRTGTLVEYF